MTVHNHLEDSFRFQTRVIAFEKSERIRQVIISRIQHLVIICISNYIFPFCEIADNFHARLEAREKRRAPAGHAGVVPLQRLRRRARERLQPREERARVSEHVYLVEETMPSLILFCHIWQHFSTFLIFGII